MRFTEVFFEVTGDISARRAITCPAPAGDAPGRRLADCLGAGWRGPVWFRWPLSRPRGVELEWQQAEPSSALASFRRRGLPVGQCVLLSGRDPAYDAATVGAMQVLVVSLLEGTGYEPGFGLLSVTERPAVLRVGLPRRLDGAERRVLSALIHSLAASFFAWVAALGAGA
jgi:hypothetical protein